MKNLFLIAALWLLACACSDSGNGYRGTNGSDTLTGPKKDTTVKGFSFGDSILMTFKYPKKWDADPDHYGRLLKSQEEEFTSVSRYYTHLMTNSIIDLPAIKHFEYMRIGEEKYCTCTDSVSLDSCRAKLPPLGKYDCYYVTADISNNAADLKKCNNSCSAYGKLLLYDRVSQVAKVVSVYYEGNGEQNAGFRYFYIARDGSIELFEGACYDDGCSLVHPYTVTVSQNGAIIIKENK